MKGNLGLAIVVAGLLGFFLIWAHYFVRFIEEYQATERTRAIASASKPRPLEGFTPIDPVGQKLDCLGRK